MGDLRILRGFTLVVDDDRNLGLDIKEMKLPVLEEIGESHHPGGSDMEIEIMGLGVKAFTLPFKLATHNPEIIGLFGGPPGFRRSFTGKKLVISDEDGKEHEHMFDCRARLSKVEGEAMTAGKIVGYDHEIKSFWNYTEFWDGRVMHRWNFKLGGWDIWNFQPYLPARRRILS
ncbi:phage major tail tube protein [Shinella sp. JR1-6]|uniref:phage major tail tube protein n=1 Tax=Shinella sp. JR1-6 TaxID=2527671 RepID=UPI00102D4B03|nr:phage major tail tube protein [Shinella sp. JR1-6]TAA54807.1 phage tail protein [Shinella sp. JR1-6]